jgi:hypothetical protein
MLIATGDRLLMAIDATFEKLRCFSDGSNGLMSLAGNSLEGFLSAFPYREFHRSLVW